MHVYVCVNVRKRFEARDFDKLLLHPNSNKNITDAKCMLSIAISSHTHSPITQTQATYYALRHGYD